MFVPITLSLFMVISRNSNPAYKDVGIPAGSWAVVEPNSIELPSRFKRSSLGRLRAILLSP